MSTAYNVHLSKHRYRFILHKVNFRAAIHFNLNNWMKNTSIRRHCLPIRAHMHTFISNALPIYNHSLAIWSVHTFSICSQCFVRHYAHGLCIFWSSASAFDLKNWQFNESITSRTTPNQPYLTFIIQAEKSFIRSLSLFLFDIFHIIIIAHFAQIDLIFPLLLWMDGVVDWLFERSDGWLARSLII